MSDRTDKAGSVVEAVARLARVVLVLSIAGITMSCAVASERATLRSKPPAEARDRPEIPMVEDDEEVLLRFAVVSDLNGRYGSVEYGTGVHRAVARLREIDPDLVLSTGDMVAGQRAGLDYDAMWAAFHEAVSDHLSADRIPFAVAPGNHDASAYAAFAHERDRYQEAWKGRKPALSFVDDEGWPFHYAFTMENTLFIALDATTKRLDREQKRWLQEILEQNRKIQNKIVFGHLPLVPFAEGKESEIVKDAELEGLLHEYGVDLYISGHHQAYYPGRRGELRVVGTGCLGGGARRLIGSTELRGKSFVVVEINRHGISSVEAMTGKHFDETLPRDELPEVLGDGRLEVLRDDIGEPEYLLARLGRKREPGASLPKLRVLERRIEPRLALGVE